jgi:hypothetical protein
MRHSLPTARAGRQLRGEVKLPSNQKIPFLLVPNGLVSSERPLTKDLAKVEEWRALEISLADKEKSLRESLGKLG